MTDSKEQHANHHARPFNSPLECGLRTLFILSALRRHPVDLQRIVSYDYLLVHSGDIENGPTSLHPAVPYRGAELLVKRKLIQAGLNQMIAKELVRIDFHSQGFLYSATDLTYAFISLLKSPYASELKARAAWICEHFHTYSDSEVDAYINNNIGRWGAEFETLAAINSLEL